MLFEQTKLFINGKFEESSSKFATNNPYDHSTLAMIHQAEPEHVRMAIQAARRAFDAWRIIPSSEKAKFLHKLADEIEKNSEKIAVSLIFGLKIFNFFFDDRKWTLWRTVFRM